MTNISKAEKTLRIMAKTDGRCGYCGKLFEPDEPVHFDHMTPKCRGGNGDESNLLPSCQRCNSKKGYKTVDEFRYRLCDGIADDVRDHIIPKIKDGLLADEGELIRLLKKVEKLLRKQDITFYFEYFIEAQEPPLECQSDVSGLGQ